MPSFTRVLVEGLCIGLVLIVVTYLAAPLAKALAGKPSLPEVCAAWNDNYIMEVNLLLAGVLFHVLAQYSGVNAWYVKNYK